MAFTATRSCLLILVALASSCGDEEPSKIDAPDHIRLAAAMLDAYRAGGAVATLTPTQVSCDAPLPAGVVLRMVSGVTLENTPLDLQPNAVVFVQDTVLDDELSTFRAFSFDAALSGLPCASAAPFPAYLDMSGSFNSLTEPTRDYVLDQMSGYPEVMALEERPTPGLSAQ